MELFDEKVIGGAIVRAADLLQRSESGRTWSERRHAQRLSALMADPVGQRFAGLLADQLFRSRDPKRAADQWRHIVTRLGMPGFLGSSETLLMRTALSLGYFAPGPVMRALRRQMRGEAASVILPAREPGLGRHLGLRQHQGTTLNLNHLGEAVLGEGEAAERLDAYGRLLERSDVSCVSVKISAICSQLSPYSFDWSVDRIVDRLSPLLRRAVRAGGKRITLDMEAHHDLDLTLAAFERIAADNTWHGIDLGIALQCYLPDSWDAYDRVLVASGARVRDGGPAMRVRLVKGANLMMEQVEAELSGWVCPVLPDKPAVDANYKAMLDHAIRPKHLRVLQVGVASHNLFDISLALELARARQCPQGAVTIEMLEGMANHQAKAVADVADGLLMYAPVVDDDDFQSAIAYLTRRLDENTAPQNFLRALFDLEVGSAAWTGQEHQFRHACREAARVDRHPRRRQNRLREKPDMVEAGFANDSLTDWTRPANRNWLEKHLAAYRPVALAPPQGIAAMERDIGRLSDGIIPWSATPVAERATLLRRVALVLACHRGALLAALIQEGNKIPAEADAEICEAIDFANYYADTGVESWNESPSDPLGVIAVCPPWNFPLAIPIGGVLAALMAGNTVLLKPAPQTQALGWRIHDLLTHAGIPEYALALCTVPEERLGSRLVKNRRIAGVILTGAAETARRFLDWRPDLRLFAETGGKNSITITDLADRDQAISDLIHSAFGHAGQKCSAASLGICEAAVYDDPEFRRRLRDAAASLEVGPADSAGVRIPPLIRHPGTELERALNHCEDGQKWLLKPRCLDAEGSRRLWTPGIKLGVKRGSWFHQTECFGPILGLMRARSLDHAISLANAVPYGLTAGLQSLDEREIAHWLEHIDAGNCYVNRSITGAVVRRQPFGGWKASRYGPGAKAGGPRYVDQFRRRHQRDEGRTVSTVDSAWRRIFGRCHDPSALASERNILRWKPRPGLFLALGAEPSVSQQSLLRLVAATAGVPVHTVLNRRPVPAPELPADGVLAIIGQRRDRDELLALAHQQNWLVITEQVPDAESAFGLLMRPQSISITAHRYGNRELGRWHLPGLGAE